MADNLMHWKGVVVLLNVRVNSEHIQAREGIVPSPLGSLNRRFLESTQFLDWLILLTC